ncbi:hypothetical protein ACFLRI_03135 [Bacteroidota bacterium]
MSDKNLEQLIDSIKTEAIDKAEKEAEKILSDAKLKAQGILKDAQQKKESELKDAGKEASEIIDKGKIALQQASRDLVLSLQNELLGLFKAALEKEIKAELKPDTIKSIILSVVDNMGKGGQINLPADNLKQLSDFIQTKAKDMSFSEDDTVSAGLKVVKTSEGWSYNINPETIAEALLPYLNTNWVEILKGGAGK